MTKDRRKIERGGNAHERPHVLNICCYSLSCFDLHRQICGRFDISGVPGTSV